MAKQKYYAVAKGRSTGIFDNWEECQESIKGFSGATYKSFNSQELAEQYLIGQGVFTIEHHSNLEFTDKGKNKEVRMVDANKVIEILTSHPGYVIDQYGGFAIAIDDIEELIREVPTAYDSNEVVEQVRGIGTVYCTNVGCNNECDNCDHGCMMNAIINKVKAGGIDV